MFWIRAPEEAGLFEVVDERGDRVGGDLGWLEVAEARQDDVVEVGLVVGAGASAQFVFRFEPLLGERREPHLGGRRRCRGRVCCAALLAG